MDDIFLAQSRRASHAFGTPVAFVVALLVVVCWAASGPIFAFGTTWQLVINTGTTIVTFLMVFLIQSTQNRDSAAIHLKLDELLRSSEQARSGLVQLEDLSEDELRHLRDEFAGLHQEHPASDAGEELREDAGEELAGRGGGRGPGRQGARPSGAR